ncbi:hypothetical protein DRQ36_07360 [bacterium]|nr:MAG: hypothetical protein DRQ36_07360 [bacterium]
MGYNRKCKECKHYRVIGGFDINYECKLYHKTPQFEETEACRDFEMKGWLIRFCRDCIYYKYEHPERPCEKGYDIPLSGHACREYERR